ncbi:cell division protein ZapE [Niveibacterium sp. 24ML]|uniref:cell division protein ZapE n=1 Tax=Niveibacterium sp. 24ML TaxID=2985512 RepID=UPI00226D9101|nr:cell division protein ZapE [Niveibacterium sp. 24ML]MCX9157242.1 cell division protein ZapE [Niveibacterium sp. 24ML]
MPHRTLNVPEFGVRDSYETLLKARGYKADVAQRNAIARLQALYTDLLTFKSVRRTRIRKMLFNPHPPRSVYLWGGVGRGKSFIMDCFFDAVPYQRKRRVHFHAFMREVHESLRSLKDEPDPLLRVAERIARQTRLLCFDEFHVSDIADAMMLGRLLDALFERGLVFVMTSNYPPDGLYPNGLQRQNFLPTIDLIKRRFDVLEVDHGTDYRLRALERMNIYIVPAGPEADQQLADEFKQIAGAKGLAGQIALLDRAIPAVRLHDGAIWFDFATLCGGPRSQNDYLELARRYHTLFLSDVPVMTREQGNEARRFTWLVDVLYDCRVKLIISAAADAYDLYREGPNAQEFPRTVSRLIEMRSRDYLMERHRPV